MEKEKIVRILKTYFSGVYCDTCDGNLEADKCDECHRKNMHWAISSDSAEELADKLLEGEY